ncbi:hypothetical protein D6825_02225 [Candidatus Woesearchaeota archaeon]|nr:MAG: hypothetical protein D6825_02225 [Candidatus Woesearchaeota archaeon]
MIPGKGYSGYYSLKDIIEEKRFETPRIVFVFEGNQLFANGKPIQGLRIVDNYAIIKGIHYTSWEGATQIRSTERLEPSLDDPFVYLAQPGVMQGWPEHLIKKELGARVANTAVKVQVVVPLERVWLKVGKNAVHFAISGVVSEYEIKKIEVQRLKQFS